MRFKYYKLEKNNVGYTFILFLNQSTEFANEFDHDEIVNKSFVSNLKQFIQEKFPDLKVTAIKVVVGTTIISSFAIQPTLAQDNNYEHYTNYTVKAGDTLWKIANQFGTTVNNIKSLNQLSSNTIFVGQNLKIPEENTNINLIINGEVKQLNPSPVMINNTTYLPIRNLSEALGASIWYNADSKTIGINKGDMKIAFVIGSSVARVNGESVSVTPSRTINGITYVPIRFISETFGLSVNWDGTNNTVTLSDPSVTTYTVVSGDTLFLIANKYHTTISSLKELNQLTSDTIYIGQVLKLPITQQTAQTKPYITYKSYFVQKGDNIWDLSIKFGIPMTELLKVNGLNLDSSLSLNQELSIPVHHIPVKPVIAPKYGELLDWWTEAQYVFQIGKTARVIDFQTGRSFYVKRTIGANHSDTEPLTASDAAIIKEIWGGQYSWSKRAVIVEVDGRRIAASMASMPHSIQYIHDNNFDGHFDIHFLNSTRHKDGLITEEHQRQVKIAAGLIQP